MENKATKADNLLSDIGCFLSGIVFCKKGDNFFITEEHINCLNEAKMNYVQKIKSDELIPENKGRINDETL